MDTKINQEMDKGHELLKTGKDDLAIQHFKNLCELFSNEGAVWLNSALVLDTLGFEEEAIPQYLRAIDLKIEGKDLRDALVCLASSYRNVGDLEKSLYYLNLANQTFKEDLVVLAFLALVLHDLNCSSEALSMIGLTLLKESSSNDLQAYNKALTQYYKNLPKNGNSSLESSIHPK